MLLKTRVNITPRPGRNYFRFTSRVKCLRFLDPDTQLVWKYPERLAQIVNTQSLVSNVSLIGSSHRMHSTEFMAKSSALRSRTH
jgi:hypothetical protein